MAQKVYKARHDKVVLEIYWSLAKNVFVTLIKNGISIKLKRSRKTKRSNLCETTKILLITMLKPEKPKLSLSKKI